MSAVHKPQEAVFEKNVVDLAQDRLDEALSDFEAFTGHKVKRTEIDHATLEGRVQIFFMRVESVTAHVLDRLGVLATKGAAYLDRKGG